MTLDMARHVLLWCTIINYGFILVWILLIILARGWLYRFWGHWFHLPAESFDAINFAGILLYKVGVVLFNMVPLIALYLVHS